MYYPVKHILGLKMSNSFSENCYFQICSEDGMQNRRQNIILRHQHYRPSMINIHVGVLKHAHELAVSVLIVSVTFIFQCASPSSFWNLKLPVYPVYETVILDVRCDVCMIVVIRGGVCSGATNSGITFLHFMRIHSTWSFLCHFHQT